MGVYHLGLANGVPSLSRNDILGWFARVECRVDTDCINFCTMLELEGVRQRVCPRKIWNDV